MKETINVNLAQQAFTMDMDAYRSLTGYLDEISHRLPEEDNETLVDIEARVAEIFRERIPSPMMVITIGTVESVIQQIGTPETFGETERPSVNGESEEESGTPRKKLYRSRSCRALAGVCGGIAEYMGWDVSLLRLAAILLLIGGGSSMLLYIILWIVMPEEPVRKITLSNDK